VRKLLKMWNLPPVTKNKKPHAILEQRLL